VGRSGRHFEGDGDDDDAARPRRDFDDELVRDYGHAVGGGEQRAVAALLGRFYAAVAAGDGAGACSLLYGPLTRAPGLYRAIPKADAPAPGSPLLRGNCAQVATLLFGIERPELAEHGRPQLVEARVSGDRGIAVIGFASAPERQLPLRRDGGTWKVAALLDSLIP
jgi:hypothetical protein